MALGRGSAKRRKRNKDKEKAKDEVARRGRLVSGANNKTGVSDAYHIESAGSRIQHES